MPVVARNVDDRRDGNEWKFVTRSHGSFRSGVVGNMGSIYCSIQPRLRGRRFCCCGIYLGRAGHTLEFPFRRNGRRVGAKVDPSKKKNWKDRGVGHEFSFSWEFMGSICVCVQPLFSLSFFFSFDKWRPIIFFSPPPRGAKVSVFWRSWFWGEVGASWIYARVIKQDSITWRNIYLTV